MSENNVWLHSNCSMHNLHTSRCSIVVQVHVTYDKEGVDQAPAGIPRRRSNHMYIRYYFQNHTITKFDISVHYAALCIRVNSS